MEQAYFPGRLQVLDKGLNTGYNEDVNGNRRERPDYGIYTSDNLEIVHTENFQVEIYSNSTAFGMRLYKNSMAAAVCEHIVENKMTCYAFYNRNNEIVFNVKRARDEIKSNPAPLPVTGLNLLAPIEMARNTVLPHADDLSIGACLKTWNRGANLEQYETGLFFLLDVHNLEYICQMYKENDNIYCGASINIPTNKGLIGGRQYFRIRNFGDNNEPFCGFSRDLESKKIDIDIDENLFTPNSCNITNKGIYWAVKQFDDSRIVLQGCGGDEYIYERNRKMVERYK